MAKNPDDRYATPADLSAALAPMAKPGATAMVAILFIVVIALAGLGIAVVNALAESPWGAFTIAMTIPLGMFMGMWMYVWRKGRITEATILTIAGASLGPSSTCSPSVGRSRGGRRRPRPSPGRPA